MGMFDIDDDDDLGDAEDLKPVVPAPKSSAFLPREVQVAEAELSPDTMDEYDRELYNLLKKQLRMADMIYQRIEDLNAKSRDVYAYSNIMNQIRETIADLRASRDVSNIADDVIDKVLYPYHVVAGQCCVDILKEMVSFYNANINNQDTRERFSNKLKKIIEDSAHKFNDAYNKSRDDLTKVL